MGSEACVEHRVACLKTLSDRCWCFASNDLSLEYANEKLKIFLIVSRWLHHDSPICIKICVIIPSPSRSHNYFYLDLAWMELSDLWVSIIANAEDYTTKISQFIWQPLDGSRFVSNDFSFALSWFIGIIMSMQSSRGGAELSAIRTLLCLRKLIRHLANRTIA